MLKYVKHRSQWFEITVQRHLLTIELSSEHYGAVGHEFIVWYRCWNMLSVMSATVKGGYMQLLCIFCYCVWKHNYVVGSHDRMFTKRACVLLIDFTAHIGYQHIVISRLQLATGWPLTWKTWKSQGIPKWSGKSQGKWKKSGKSQGKWNQVRFFQL